MPFLKLACRLLVRSFVWGYLVPAGTMLVTHDMERDFHRAGTLLIGPVVSSMKLFIYLFSIYQML